MQILNEIGRALSFHAGNHANETIISCGEVVVFPASAAAAVSVFAVIAVSVAGAAVRLVAF
jgi:hypothetical protein